MSAARKSPEQELAEVARRFAERLVETANDRDPQREADFQKREDAHQDAVSKALKAHLSKRKK